MLTHSHQLRNTLLDLGPARIEAMDGVGIAIQFLSVSSPGFEQFETVVQVEHVMFASDYPWERIEDGADFIEAAPISEDDRRKICHENAEQLFGLRV